jgi:hypothetical protein
MSAAPIVARVIESHPEMAGAPEVAERPMRAIDPDRKAPLARADDINDASGHATWQVQWRPR